MQIQICESSVSIFSIDDGACIYIYIYIYNEFILCYISSKDSLVYVYPNKVQEQICDSIVWIDTACP